MAADACILCGRPIRGLPLIEKIDGKEYAFGSRECALMLKKLKSVYGSDFCVNFAT